MLSLAGNDDTKLFDWNVKWSTKLTLVCHLLQFDMPLKYSKACHFSSPKKRHQPINQKLARLMTWGHQQPVPTRNACIPGQQQVEGHFHAFPNPHFRTCFMIGENRWHSASRRLRLFIAHSWVPKYMEISDYPFGGCHSLWGHSSGSQNRDMQKSFDPLHPPQLCSSPIIRTIPNCSGFASSRASSLPQRSGLHELKGTGWRICCLSSRGPPSSHPSKAKPPLWNVCKQKFKQPGTQTSCRDCKGQEYYKIIPNFSHINSFWDSKQLEMQAPCGRPLALAMALWIASSHLCDAGIGHGTRPWAWVS